MLQGHPLSHTLPTPCPHPARRDMIDEQQQHPQQLELAGIAVTCFWLLLRHAAAQHYSWPIRCAAVGVGQWGWAYSAVASLCA